MPRFEVYLDDADEYRWNLEADDGEVLVASGEGYPSRDECMESMESFTDGAGNYEHYVGGDGDQRWRLRADDGQIVAVSGRGYFLKRNCEEAYAIVRAEALDAEISEE